MEMNNKDRFVLVHCPELGQHDPTGYDVTYARESLGGEYFCDCCGETGHETVERP